MEKKGLCSLKEGLCCNYYLKGLGSAEESGRSRASMRPATSLDAISHHRVIATGREFPSRSATISTTARNHVTKPFPNASSESDLSRYRTRLKDRKSPSLSNLTAEGMKHKFSFQDPNAAKGLFPNSKGHQKIDKVAHVGQVVSTLFVFLCIFLRYFALFVALELFL
nr:uncharacterized protein LOC113807381 [Penaeus vannamei]